jgi:hypothetical protein
MTLSIHPDIVRTYRETNYRVSGLAAEFTLQVGRVSQELAGLMADAKVMTAAFLTNNSALAGDIANLGLQSFSCESCDPSGKNSPKLGLLVVGITLHDADALALHYNQNAFLWISTPAGLPSLRLLMPLQVPDEQALARWRASLPLDEAQAAEMLPRREQAALMATPQREVRHWLLPALWDIRQPWPVARPDGGAMGIGSELDRMFKLVAAGVVPAITSYQD